MAHDPELDIYTTGLVQPHTTVIVPNLIATITRWRSLGIRVTERYRDGKMIQRLVDYV